MAGAFLAIGTCMSAMTKNQVVSFILGVVTCLLFILAGFDVVLEFFRSWAPAWLTDAIASVSFFTHFNSAQRGVIDLTNMVFFASLIVGWLAACGVILQIKKAH
jgi:ABC-2 type transport system permease protein